MIELPPQSAVVIRWTFMTCVILIFAALMVVVMFSPRHFWTGLIAGWSWLQRHS